MRLASRKLTPEEKAASRARSNANLKRGNKATQFVAGREQTEIARKGGLAKQKKFRETRTAREMLAEIMSYKPVLTPQLRDGLIHLGADPKDGEYTAGFLGFVALQQKVMRGDVKATQLWLEITGQDPKVVLEQDRLALEKESLKQGVTGYSALDEAFAKMNDGSEES